MQAAIDGSEEVWSAILASTLTHICGVRAAAVPHGRLEHHVQAARGRRDVLAGDVAVRRGHARAGALLEAAAACRRPSNERRGLTGRLYTWSETRARRHGRGYRALLHMALASPADGAARRARRCSSSRSSSCRYVGFGADAADRRRRGHGRRRAAGRHPHRAHRSGDSPARADGAASWCPSSTSSSATAAAAASWAARATAAR